MKCAKCGNEIKEGTKFCPQCGEAVKEEKKVRFCTKCGSELQEGAAFCAKCGESIDAMQKQDSSVKPANQHRKLKKICMILGATVVIFLIAGSIMLNSDKAMYKAYAKFHEEYCDKNLKYEDFNDCAAKIIMSPDNEKWLAIYDITNLVDEGEGGIPEEYIKDKITLYRYSWGKVKKVATFSKQRLTYCEFVDFSVINDELYLFTDYDMEIGEISKNGNVKGIYHLNGDKFETVKAKEEKIKYRELYGSLENVLDGIDPDEEYSTYIIDSGMEVWDLMFLGNCGYFYKSLDGWEEQYKWQLRAVNDVRFTNVNEFAEVVDELTKYKIKNQTDLQIAYGKTLKEYGLHPGIDENYGKPLSSDYPVVGTMKTEYGYYYVRTSGNVALAGLEEKTDFYKAVKSADGRKVTGIESVGGTPYIPEKLKIPDNITYIGKEAFIGRELESVEFPESIKRIGAFAFCNCNLLEVDLPDSVEKIGENAFAGEYGLLLVIIASEDSYAQQYAEENNLEWSDKNLSKEEVEERRLIAEALGAYQAYISSDELSDTFAGVTLTYINDDNIPECFLWHEYDQMYWLGLTVLSYTGGEIISQEFNAGSMYDDFTFMPGSGKICGEYWVNGLGAGYTVCSLTDKFETTAVVNDFLAGRAEEREYTVNGEDYGSHEAIEEYISSLGLNISFSEEDICDNIREAYEDLIKDE